MNRKNIVKTWVDSKFQKMKNHEKPLKHLGNTLKYLWNTLKVPWKYLWNTLEYHEKQQKSRKEHNIKGIFNSVQVQIITSVALVTCVWWPVLYSSQMILFLSSTQYHWYNIMWYVCLLQHCAITPFSYLEIRCICSLLLKIGLMKMARVF